MKQLRLVLWGLVALALAGLAFLLLRPAPPVANAPQVAVQSSFGAPFNLVDAQGRPFASSQLNGTPYALFFGFTHCPDVCPTTLARLAKLRTELGQGDDAFRIVFVTVDPDRDGPKEVGAYADAFNTPIVGLTGTAAQIDRVKKDFGIYSAKVPGDGADYSVDHTATVLLFDRNGKFVATIAPDEQDGPALDKIRRIAG
ncbi:SCO family protein [Sphingomonas sabuli]|uniref:SCO family protein n=1 Tax=Sphingomonas sabuli TaxID=2764186 RepID=A0A7G9L1Y3_9SPHN|nr:SCO family protein [Sphingomonas sabuli]QNM82632.1 SCO family protein [Sphingomonas sabuli]